MSIRLRQSGLHAATAPLKLDVDRVCGGGLSANGGVAGQVRNVSRFSTRWPTHGGCWKRMRFRSAGRVVSGRSVNGGCGQTRQCALGSLCPSSVWGSVVSFRSSTLVVAGDTAPMARTRRDIERIVVQLLSEAADDAADGGSSAGAGVSIERRHLPTTWGRRFGLIEAMRQTESGHLPRLVSFSYTGPSKAADLELLTPANLFHVQLCDLVAVPRELASDADRVLPGEGDSEVEPIIERLAATRLRGGLLGGTDESPDLADSAEAV